MPDVPEATCISDLESLGHDLLDEASGIQSASLDRSGSWNVRLFAFPAGTGLPEHAVDRHAILHFVVVTATVDLNDQEKEANAHTWISIPPRMPHAIAAHADTLMLLHVRETG